MIFESDTWLTIFTVSAAGPYLIVAFGLPIVLGWWLGDWDDFA